MGHVLQVCFLALAVLSPVLTPTAELLSRFPRRGGGEQLGSYQGLEMVCRMCWGVCVGGTHSCRLCPELALAQIPTQAHGWQYAVPGHPGGCGPSWAAWASREEGPGTVPGVGEGTTEPLRALFWGFLGWALRSEYSPVSLPRIVHSDVCGAPGMWPLLFGDKEPALWPRPGVRTVI